jgi:hypothetical protein
MKLNIPASIVSTSPVTFTERMANAASATSVESAKETVRPEASATFAAAAPSAARTIGAPSATTTTASRPSSVLRARSRVETVNGGTTRLTTRAKFDAFSKTDSVPGAANVRAMKFLVVGVDTPRPKVWLIDANTSDYHFNFATQALGQTVDLATFNSQTYFTDNRKNIAGTVLAYDGFGANGTYTMEFWPTDPVKANHVDIAFELLQKALPFTKNNLSYHPAGDTQEALATTESATLKQLKVPVLSTAELFAGVTFSPLNIAEGVGVEHSVFAERRRAV